MKSTIRGSLAGMLVLVLMGCGSGVAEDVTSDGVGLAAQSATGAPEAVFGGHGGHDGHGGHHGDGGGHGVPGCHDAGPSEDAIVGDEGGREDPGPGPAEGNCSGLFEMRAQSGPNDGGYEMSSWRSGPFTSSDQPLLYVVGIYESTSAHRADYHPYGEATLHIGPTQRPLVLALSSYEPTNWILDIAEGAVIQQVVLLGYYPQALTNYAAEWPFTITDLSNGDTEAYGYCWPSCSGGGDTPRMIQQVQSATGLTVEAYDGIYRLEDLTIEHICTDCTPDCSNRNCGGDGCGGTCGECRAGDWCGDAGRCLGRDDDVHTGICPGPYALRFFESLPEDTNPVTSYRSGPLVTGDDPLLYLIGIYDSAPYHFMQTSEAGRTVLHIGPTQRPLVLALAAYEENEWVLDLDPAAVVQSVVLLGYKPQTLTAPGAIPVTDLSRGDTVTYGYCWPFCDGGGNTPKLVAQVESVTGMTLGAFDGVYHLEEAWIHNTCTGCTANCDGLACGSDGCGGTCGECEGGYTCMAGQCLASEAAPACDGLPPDPHYCLALTPTGASLLGLESGTVCSLGPQDGVLSAAGMMATSIAWQGDHAFMCNEYLGYDGLMRYSLVDGTYDIAPVASCLGVASWNGGLAVLIQDLGFHVRAYASFDDAMAGNALPVDFRVDASRMNVRGDTVFAAWHSTDEIQRYELPEGTEGDTIHLEAYDTWVQGLSVTDDDLLVVSAWWPEKRITVFDLGTGTALWTLTNLHVPTEFTGLVCRSH